MITKCLILNETSLDPVHNLAVESTLLANAKRGECVLYLWQNQNTVVIGRNQDAWRECRIAELIADGGTLVRRPTGGGAVFHDMGNLNFSFVLPQRDYDVPRQLSVIMEALRTFGLNAEATGRNDITLNGLKFSGNAFLQQDGFCLHHGTLLVDVDMQKMSRYLMPSQLKLQSKGIASVQARVTNLRAACDALTVEALRSALSVALGKVYGVDVDPCLILAPKDSAFRTFEEKYRSKAWVLGQSAGFTCEAHDRFPWGEASLGLTLREGIIVEAKLYTDAMDATLAGCVEELLTGLVFTRVVMDRLCGKWKGTPIGDLMELLKINLEP